MLGMDFAGQLGQMAQTQQSALDALQRQAGMPGMLGNWGGIGSSGSAAQIEQQRRAVSAVSDAEKQIASAIHHASKTLKKGKPNMVRDYMNRHKDMLFTLVMALLIDQFVLGGALRQRIQRVVEAALERIEKALGLPAEPERLT